jgi:hypothetical protein
MPSLLNANKPSRIFLLAIPLTMVLISSSLTTPAQTVAPLVPSMESAPEESVLPSARNTESQSIMLLCYIACIDQSIPFILMIDRIIVIPRRTWTL